MKKQISGFDKEIQKNLLELIKELSGVFRSNNNRSGRSERLTSRQAEFINTIRYKTKGNPTLNETAAALGTTRQNARQLLDSLLKKKLVEIAKDKKDKRTIRIKILDDAEKILKEKQNLQELNLEALFDEVEIKDIYTVYDFLNVLKKKISKK